MSNIIALQQVAKQFGGYTLPDNNQWTDRIQIRSETSSRLYVVARRKGTNNWACSCFGWKAHRHCKHLSTMIPLLKGHN